MTRALATALRLALLGVLGGTSLGAQTPAPASTPPALAGAAGRIQADVEALASDKLRGRRAGTPDADAAAQLIADRFREIGLLPGGTRGTYFQPFDFIDSVETGPKSSLVTAGSAPVGRTWVAGTDFRPLASSSAGAARGEVVFAGYGIVAKDLGYDDYAGLDVTDKVVLVLRHAPGGDDPGSPFLPYTALRTKAAAARAKGARALLVATGPSTKNGADDLVAPRTDLAFEDAGLVAVSVKRAVAESLFAGSGKTLASAQKALDGSRRPGGFALSKSRVELVCDVTPHRVETRNVLGFLPGTDPMANSEFVVIGAHYDHLGLGGPASLDPSPDGKIHHGADDNASGVAALLELARTAVERRRTVKRSLLFIAFGAEELGTLGSLHYTRSPTVPLAKTLAMINLDMVGRLRGDRLDVHGVGTSPIWKPLVARANAALGLKLTLHEGGFGPSDHASFYAADRPVLFLFTGTHADYHRPSDTADRIDAKGIEKVVSFLSPIVWGLLDAPEKPAFSRPPATKVE